ncbi:MAG: S41 family peptidase [Cyclobacteriaceae bacterium]|nr:S41 family peptidase [Cyclobacteriaceae bacterium HetDA_MAG_MS6]
MADNGSGKSNLLKSMNKIRQVLTYIENDYVDEVDTEKLAEGAITDMLEELDPHSVYIPEEEFQLMRSQLEGNFEGIGIEFNIFKDTIHVVAPLSGGPSERVGLLSGDKIITVDGENVAGVGLVNRDVIKKLRGPKGSEVTVGIQRRSTDDVLEFTIQRDVIPQYSVDVSYMVDDEIGYIKVSRFSATTYMEFKEALYKLQQKGMAKLILDLTGNPGGYMDRAVDMVDEFIAGSKMIVYTKGKESRYDDQHLSKREGDFEEGGLVVMIDEGSASASEIVSGAIQDHDRGIIVGRRSFGKGLVQMPIPLNDGSELRLTISRYYTPSGRSIQKPYEEGEEKYHQEYASRFESGEVFDETNVVINDSLKYETSKGRTVYGGGGIVPDYFVPFDTAGNSTYMNRLFTSNSVAEYTLTYREKHHEELEAMGLEGFLANFDVSENMLKELVSVGRDNNVAFAKNDFNASKNQLKLYLKAYIGRSIWDNEGFYPVINKQNEIFKKALTLFDAAKELAMK